ncbi:MAG: hypothetical protein RSC41_06885, partial [Oscillospiraceae bacterium]
MNRYFKRIVSGAMSAIMVMGYFVPLATVAEAAIKGPSFEFLESDLDKASDTIIEGTTSAFKINHVNNFILATASENGAFEIVDEALKPFVDTSKLDIIKDSNTKATITTYDGLLDAGVLSKQFFIKGKYNVLQAETENVTESFGTYITHTKAKLERKEGVTQKSTIEFKCTDD